MLSLNGRLELGSERENFQYGCQTKNKKGAKLFSYHPAWATKLSLAAIGLVFPAQDLGYGTNHTLAARGLEELFSS
jgi:hypothetical protein